MSKKPLRVLHVVGVMDRAGIETWLMHMLRRADRSRVHFDFLVHGPGAYDEEIRSLGAGVYLCPSVSNSLSGYWKWARAFRRALDKGGPYDIVHSQMGLFSGIVLRLAKKHGVPFCITHHHHLDHFENPSAWRKFYTALMRRWTLLSTHLVLAPSVHSLTTFREEIAGQIPFRGEVIYNAVDLSRFQRSVNREAIRRQYGLPVDALLVIYVARFATHKNHVQALRLAKRLQQEQDTPRVHFLFVGSQGELMEEVRRQAATVPSVTVLTGIKDVSDLLLASDLFFFPSLVEGFGVVAIEACAAGLPVVATDLPAIREAVPERYHEFLFASQDDDTAQYHLTRLCNDPNLRASLAVEGRRFALQFSVESSLNHLTCVYEQLTQREFVEKKAPKRVLLGQQRA